MKDALFAIKIYGGNLYDSPVPHKVDNTPTLSWINKQTAPKESIFGLLGLLYSLSLLGRLYSKEHVGPSFLPWTH